MLVEMKKLLKLLLIVLILALFGTELSLRFIAAHYSIPTKATDSERLPAYSHSPWWTPEFNREMREANASWKVSADGFLFAPDYRGHYISFVNNRRTTTGQPVLASRTLWMFGSSTTFDMFVPDNLTIASNLQHLVGSRLRVENMGRPSINAAKELVLLKQTIIRSGDIVIFYDGALDFLTPYQVAQNRQTQQTDVCRWLLDRVGWSALVQVGCAFAHQDSVTDTEALTYWRAYNATIAAAKVYSEAHGAVFVHFIEPTMFGDGLAKTITIFKEAPNTVDLTHCLDDLLASGVPVYFEEGHMNEHGDAGVALAIYDVLFPLL